MNSVFSLIWPVLVILISNTVYQVCAKGIPPQMNTYASMTVTYAVATLFSAIMFFVTTKGGNILHEFKMTNWASIVLGVVITGLELGFIFAYKAGWKVSTLSITTNAFLAISLLFLGFFLYHESLNWNKIVGIVICIIGLWFINK